MKLLLFAFENPWIILLSSRRSFFCLAAANCRNWRRPSAKARRHLKKDSTKPSAASQMRNRNSIPWTMKLCLKKPAGEPSRSERMNPKRSSDD